MIKKECVGRREWRYSRDNKAQHDQQVLLILLHQPSRCEQDDDNIETQHHGQKLALQGSKVEALHDNTGKGTQTTGRQGSEHLDTAVAPCLRVTESLPHLVRAELSVLNTGLVGTQALNHHVLVLLAEALGTHRRVGHPPHDEQTPEDRQTSVGEEQCLPGLEDLVTADQGEAVGEQTTDDLLSTVHHVPVGDGVGLLLTLVPHGREQDKGRLTAGLEDTQQRADNHQAGEVVAGRVESQDHTPQANVDAEVFADGNALDDPVGWVFDDQDSDVDTGGEPGVLDLG